MRAAPLGFLPRFAPRPRVAGVGVWGRTEGVIWINGDGVYGVVMSRSQRYITNTGKHYLVYASSLRVDLEHNLPSWTTSPPTGDAP